ncbi:MAG TPA: flagellar protein FlaG [Thauera sp.]|uniref:flagellar protein FlaG n=1 Tax=Thauera sp. TaxID=1905334 RepID=UPI002B9AAEC2|nr:flagellar protein FlaG [Thauera sp.]HRP22727.1 flagellar protein FlaG [Thauera sp.]HRP67383.1 flagellar protein FlaG [Thauera sp.]
MSTQSISNASVSMQAMSAAPTRDAQAARTQAGSATSVETRTKNVQQSTTAHDQAQRVPSAGELQRALEEVEKAVAPMAQSLQFSLDKDSGKTVVKVMDTDTNEVIRQIPSEEVLAISKAVDKLKGLLIKQQA